MPEPCIDDANAAAVLVFHPDDLHVLVECGPRGDRLPGVPGGKREPGETAAECAARELFEETGIVVPSSTLVPVLLAPAGRHLCQLFLAPRVPMFADLCAGARWAPIEELLGPSRFPDFYTRALERLSGVLAPARREVFELERLRLLINTPHTDDFFEGVRIEAAHQRERWGEEHDARKTPVDWFWVVGYLAGKAIRPGEPEKAQHRVIALAALALNWWRWIRQKED